MQRKAKDDDKYCLEKVTINCYKLIWGKIAQAHNAIAQTKF